MPIILFSYTWPVTLRRVATFLDVARDDLKRDSRKRDSGLFLLVRKKVHAKRTQSRGNLVLIIDGCPSRRKRSRPLLGSPQRHYCVFSTTAKNKCTQRTHITCLALMHKYTSLLAEGPQFRRKNGRGTHERARKDDRAHVCGEMANNRCGERFRLKTRNARSILFA